MKIGYARVSTYEQNLALQVGALTAAGYDKVFEDHVSGAKRPRPDFGEALSHLRKGDTLVVWRLDRLGRSLKHLGVSKSTLYACTDNGVCLGITSRHFIFLNELHK